MQDLNPNVKTDECEAGGKNKKKRRVSFSRTQQVKEFQAGQTNLTVWNNTYEEEKSELQSCSNGSSVNVSAGTPTAAPAPASAPVSNRVEQIQVCFIIALFMRPRP